MASLREVGERALVANLARVIRPCGRHGPGDDAVEVDGRDVLVCTDLITFERHFPRGMSFEQFGWTAAAVNLSDIASMGARPLGVLIAAALPGDCDESDLYDLVSGADQCAEFCETHIIGGDTKEGPGVVAGTALGTTDGRPPLTRYGAAPGDIVAVTGALGSAAAGYFALKDGLEDDSTFSLYVPVPRIKEGLELSFSGAVTSCIDLSDGLAVAAGAVCACSRVGMDIQWEFLPEGDGVDRVSRKVGIPKKRMMLYRGGEYELMFTFRKDMVDRLYERGLQFTIIGIVTNDDGPYLLDGEKRVRMEDGEY